MKMKNSKRVFAVVMASLFSLSSTVFTSAVGGSWGGWGGGIAVSAHKVTATTWTNSAASIKAEVYEVVGARSYFDTDPTILYPRKSKSLVGSHVSVTDLETLIIINATTRHERNGTRKTLTDFSNISY